MPFCLYELRINAENNQFRKKDVTCYVLFALTRRGVPSGKGRELCPEWGKEGGAI